MEEFRIFGFRLESENGVISGKDGGEVSINRDLRNAAFRHLQTLSFSYYSQNSVGYIHSRLMSDASRIGSLASWTIMESVWHIAYLIGAIVVMFSINAKLAAMVVSIVPLVALLFSLFQKKLVAVNREIREINSRITSDFNEGITGLDRCTGGSKFRRHPIAELLA